MRATFHTKDERMRRRREGGREGGRKGRGMKDLACALRVSRVVGHACILFHNGRGLTHSILLTLLFALNRFMPLFVGVLPTHVTLTIWDAFFLEEREVRACRCGRGV